MATGVRFTFPPFVLTHDGNGKPVGPARQRILSRPVIRPSFACVIINGEVFTDTQEMSARDAAIAANARW